MEIFERVNKSIELYEDRKNLVQRTKHIFPEDIIEMCIAYGYAFATVGELARMRPAYLTEEEKNVLSDGEKIRELALEKIYQYRQEKLFVERIKEATT